MFLSRLPSPLRESFRQTVYSRTERLTSWIRPKAQLNKYSFLSGPTPQVAGPKAHAHACMGHPHLLHSPTTHQQARYCGDVAKWALVTVGSDVVMSIRRSILGQTQRRMGPHELTFQAKRCQLWQQVILHTPQSRTSQSIWPNLKESGKLS